MKTKAGLLVILFAAIFSTACSNSIGETDGLETQNLGSNSGQGEVRDPYAGYTDVPAMIKGIYPLSFGLTNNGTVRIYGDGLEAGGKVLIDGIECLNPTIVSLDIAGQAEDEMYSNGASQRMDCALPDFVGYKTVRAFIAFPNKTKSSPQIDIIVEPNTIVVPADIEKLRRNMGRDFVVMNNIDFAAYNYTPIKYYAGILEGGNFTFQNLTITSNNIGVSGLISFLVDSGQINNLKLQNSTLNHTFALNVPNAVHVAGSFVGLMLGATSSVTNIEAINMTVNVVDQNMLYVAGNVALFVTGATITNSLITGGGNWAINTGMFDNCVLGALNASVNGLPNLTLMGQNIAIGGGFNNITVDALGNVNIGGQCALDFNNISF